MEVVSPGWRSLQSARLLQKLKRRDIDCLGRLRQRFVERAIFIGTEQELVQMLGYRLGANARLQTGCPRINLRCDLLAFLDACQR